VFRRPDEDLLTDMVAPVDLLDQLGRRKNEGEGLKTNNFVQETTGTILPGQGGGERLGLEAVGGSFGRIQLPEGKGGLELRVGLLIHNACAHQI
jgi:hypothetical protein